MKFTGLLLFLYLCSAVVNTALAQCTASYTFTQPDSCAGNSIQFNGSFVPASANLVWYWNFDDGGTSAIQNPVHTYNPPPGNGNVNYIDTLIVTDTLTGCSDTITHTVTVKQKPNAVLIDLFGTTPFVNCNSIPGNYVLTVDDGSTPALNSNYQVTWGGGLPPLVYNSVTPPASEVHTYNALGFFNLVYTVTGTNGCVDNTTYQVFNGNAPAVGIGINQNPSGCTPLSLDILILNTAANPPGTIYTIHFTDGSPDVILTHPPPASITHIFDSTSCGSSCNGFANAFCATITAQNPCASSFGIVGPIYVSKQSGTNFTTSPANVGCSNSPVTITNTSTAATINNNGTCTSTTPSYWTITPAGYTLNSGQLGTSPCNNNPINWGSPSLNVTFPPGNYNITLTVCSPCGDSIITKSICITDPPTAAFTSNPATGCKPLPVTVNNTSTPTTGCALLTYNWMVSFTPSPCSLTATGNWAFTNGTTATDLNPEFIFNDAGTYTITLTASNGCNPVSVTSQNIIVTAPPTLSINPLADSCGTACVQPIAIYEDCGNTINNYSWTFAGCIGASTSSSPNPPQICYPPNTGVAPVNYTINCTVSNGCGNSLTASQSFNINPIPAINSTVAEVSGNINNDGIICIGDNATLSALGTGTFTWVPATGLSAVTGSPVIANPLINTIYTITITDANSCTATTTQTIAVNTLPNPSITETDNSGLVFNDLIICSGDNATLDAGAWNNYLWSDGSTSGTLNITGLTTSTTYTVTVTDANGCNNTANSTITVNSLPTPGISGLATVCSGATANLDAGSAPGWNYLWSETSTTQVINPSASGTYTVTVTDANGCSGTNSVNVIIGTNPAPVITGINTICDGQSTSFDAGISAGWIYEWSTAATTQTISILPPYNATYTVTVTDADGCTGTAIYNLTVNPLPTPSISGVTSICTGTNTSLCGSPGYANYLWNTAAVTSCISNISAAGTYTLTVTDGNTCTASVSQNVIVNPLPGAAISGASTICPGGSTVLSVPAGNFYLWSTGVTLDNISVSGAGTFTVTVTSPQGCTSTSTPFNVAVGPASATINVAPLPYCIGTSVVLSANAGMAWQWSNGMTTQNISVGASGNYTVTVTQGGGCTASTFQSLTFFAPPAPVINGPAAICQNLPFVLNAGAGYSDYSWSNGVTTQTISPVVTGTYTVTVTNASGCTASATHSLTVNTSPNPAITGINSICQGASTTFNAGAGFINYQWNNGANTQTINIFTTGTYTVTVTALNGCTTSTTQTLTVNALPTPVITGITTICGGANATLNAGAGYIGYQWSTGAVTSIITPNIVGAYTATVTDVNGCTGSVSINLNVNTNPIPAINGIYNVCSGTNVQLTASAGYANYLWSSGSTAQTYNPPTASSAPYTVTVTDINGCTGSAIFNLNVLPSPTPAIAGNNIICQGSATSLDAGNGYPVYAWNTGASTQTITVVSASVYTVTVTGLNGCTGTTSITTIVNPLPTPFITGIFTVCSGNNASLDAGTGYANYLWSTGSGSQSINPAVAGPYTVTVTDANGCTASAISNVVVNSNPVPTITGTNIICAGEVTTFSADAGFASYIWSSGETTQTINPSSIASSTYTVTVTDINGCTGSVSYNLNVNTLPVPVITGNSTICSGMSTTFDAGLGYYNYQWSTGESTQTVILNSAANYTVTVTDNNGCTGSTSSALTVNALPTPAITGTLIICSGNNATLNANPGYAAYQWSEGSSTSTITPAIAGNFTVTVTDGNGCTNSASISVSVNSNPIPVITGNNIICQGAITTFDAGAGYSAYQWNSGANTETINPSAAGTYTVTVTDANGCTGTATYDLLVNPLPAPTVTGNNIICQGDSTILDAGNGYINYMWSNAATTQTVSLYNGAIYTVTVTDVNGCTASINVMLTVNQLPNAVITGTTEICDGHAASLDAGAGFTSYQWSTGFGGQVLNTGTAGTYTVTVTDGNGCSKSANINLIVNPNPTPVIVGNNAICTGQVGYLDAGSGYSSYQWNTGAGTQSVYPSTPGTYNVTVTDINGCTGASPDFIFTVYSAVANINASGPVDFCNGTNLLLTANSAQFYFWSTGETTQSISVNQSTTVDVTVIDTNGCEAQSAPLSTYMHENPYADFGFDSMLLCKAGFLFDFIDKSIYEPGSSLLWAFGDGYSDSVANPKHYYQASGTYTIKLTITSPYGCIKDTTYTVDVDFPPPAIPLFSMSENLVPLFDAEIKFTNESQDAVDWLWTFGDELSSMEENPIHYYDAPGTYPVKLIVRNSRGCPEEIIHPVTVAPFWLPNTFTPNGDHVNDLFFTSNYVFDVQSFEMVIYNRWADMVYKTDSFEKPWNGSAKNGSVAPEGVYVYVIKVVTKTGRKYEFTNTVDLVR